MPKHPEKRGIMTCIRRNIAYAAAFMAIWIAVLALATALLHPAITGSLSTAPASMRLALEALSLASVAVPTALFARLRPTAPAGAPRAGPSRPRGSGLGAAFGLFWLGGALGANWLAGNLSLGPAAPVAHLALWVAACLANAAFRELLVRGYAFDSLRESLGVAGATLITTALFVAFHPGAFESGPVAVLQMAAASLLLTELRLLTGGLVAPTAAHFAWNAAGGMGLGVVALADDYPHVFSCSVGVGTSLSTGVMGVEGSPWTLVVTIAFCIALAVFLRSRRADVAR